ncbi:MAG: response regulator transcription factor [Nitrospira sp. SB0677_bin_15]|nr:response regulator transcription factor [Nitrospira sp. SB0667_bin_9]MYD31455.1 response regulator transcription factor [Nitrospira sp. SB0661_bin_20]MYG40690.1 response regulator transcription factor [Nitrospira sp. SB0677_bin_15]MYH01327.1 response regulator transcription factor [Nitrospira sp. SB0675_bin_23]MYJ22585.1 response regulator transcription factor [Nitrospira sp. SB0673_bin_12]
MARAAATPTATPTTVSVVLKGRLVKCLKASVPNRNIRSKKCCLLKSSCGNVCGLPLRTSVQKHLRVLMANVKSTSQESKNNSKERSGEVLSLTARQKEILRLVAQGHTNREIGEQLNISVRTVEVHRFNLMRRLRVRNVAQLLRQAMTLRLIPKNAIPTGKAH